MWTNQSAKKELEDLIQSIHTVAEKGRSSANFIEWHLRIETILSEVFSKSPRLLNMFKAFRFSKTGQMILQGWNPNAEINQQHHSAFIDDINKTVGILEMALKELERKPLNEDFISSGLLDEKSTLSKSTSDKKVILDNEDITILFLSSSPDDHTKLRVDRACPNKTHV